MKTHNEAGALLGKPGPAILFLLHAYGGGTERHVQDLAAAWEHEGGCAYLLRAEHNGRLSLERPDYVRSLRLAYEAAEPHTLYQALRSLRLAHAHVHHFVGHGEAIRDTLGGLGVPYDFTVHDYFLICPRGHLCGRDGRYCGEPDEAGCDDCLFGDGDYRNARFATGIAAWRAAGGRWLRGARRVFVPHFDVAQRLRRYFPAIRFHERRHPESPAPRRPAEADGPVLSVAVVGRQSAHKGSDVLFACARDALDRRLPIRFVVFGPAAGVPADLSNLHILGEYREEEIFDLLEAHPCPLMLNLSLVPETYCYTLSLALATGQYLLGFDAGAQGARIRESGRGDVLPPDSSPRAINDRIAAARTRLALARRPEPFPHYKDLQRDYYGFDAIASADRA